MDTLAFSFQVKVLVAQSCLTICDATDCRPPGSSVHGTLQAGILEWVAMPFSRGSFNPGIEPGSPALQADSLPSEPPGVYTYVAIIIVEQVWGTLHKYRKLNSLFGFKNTLPKLL